ncbi:glutamate-1-semialdehyde 2,1-aminomutase [Eubacterium oxidoreducens]|uniref:Glutamate-1-semialdehyde 2,1-aminomutase n=1 Tax=Eubacterium oxidoreducens TaxID=1732 RepID=A0A1G6B9X1_EUBOX|nr:glutamate-1-semialdehyde 2,1-aminomutase [Eubacterium oxidoreducens]SDB17411.1 glutamate-1-semialdehyde 2,1-aminomutase [Eubacterium oxidoreducens]
MGITTIQSEQLFEKAQTLMPGGVNSPVRAFKAVGRNPIFIDHAMGSKIVDVDGNEYIDYVCSWGPGILGHAHPIVIDAVTKACAKGLTFGAPTRRESELAELIMAAVPAIEMVRLVSSGTEAVMSAVRAARGYTGRDLILKFTGCYHGHSDGLLVKSGSGLITNAVPDSAGVPKAYTDCTLVAEYNNEESVRELFGRYGESIAALVVEPVAANMGVVPPEEGFLQFLRDITTKYGTVLIFDEVITGFRLSIGGAAQYYGVKPDLITMGKIIGGGMPLAAYGGRKDIMEVISPLGSVYQAGTLSGNPIATAAGLATLKLLMDDQDIYKRIDDKAAQLEKAYISAGYKTVNRVGSLMSVFFTDRQVSNYNDAATSDTKAYAEYFGHMLDNGINIAPSQFEAMFISDAHTEDDIRKTIDTIRS